VVSKEKMTGLCGFQGEDNRVMWFPRRRRQGYVVSKEKMTGLCGFQGEDDRVMWFPRRR
jgi:hypothetical protein